MANIENNIIGISDFKKNPMSFLKNDEILLILNHNKRAFYCLPPELFDKLTDKETKKKNRKKK